MLAASWGETEVQQLINARNVCGLYNSELSCAAL